MKKRTIYISLFLIFIIGLVSLIGTFAIDSTITEGTSSKADYLFNIVLGDRTNRDILIPSYDSKIVDIKISNPNEFNMSYLLYLEGVNSNISIINISDTEVSGILNSKTTNLIKVFIQNNSSSDITTSIKDLVGFEKETLSLPSNSTAINKGVYYKSIVKSSNKDYGKVKPNIKLSTKNGTVKYNLVPNDGYQYKSTTCDGTVSNNILTISNITSNISCEVVFEPKNITVSLDLGGGVVETTYTEPKEHTYTVPATGTYKIELWGAQGGGISSLPGGYGSYVGGNISLNADEKIYIYVGENYNGYKNNASFNGGGKGSYSTAESSVNYNGGGATDVRLVSGEWNNSSSLASRIMVAAGGGGYANWSAGSKGGNAGGLIGYDGNRVGTITVSTGGTQTSGGLSTDNVSEVPRAGVFGIGGYSETYSSQWIYVSGGGGGYYGGGSGGSISGSVGSAAGGSSYISGHTGCVAIVSLSSVTPKTGCTTGTSDNSCSVHYSGKVFTNTVMIDGSGYAWTNTKGTLKQMPSLSGNYASGVGNSGNGAARVALVSNANYNVTYKDKYGTLPMPTRDGYKFDGWYTGENGTGTKVDENTVLTIANNHTLYAKWDKIIKVSLDVAGGNYNISTTYTEVKSHTYTTPYTGTYKIEAWGASGNNNYNDYTKANPSYAGYTAGVISLTKGEVLYLYVGGQGQTFNCCTVQGNNAGSGGASDVRLVSGDWNNTASLASRIMVAGGAGGSYSDSSAPGGGSAGGLISYAVAHNGHPVASSTQIAGGTAGYKGTDGGFGYGGTNSNYWYNPGAGGYYGGGSGPAGGGGTSYISGHTGCVAITSANDITPKTGCDTGNSDNSCSLHYSGKEFTNTVMIDGLGYAWANTKGSLRQMPKPTGGYYASGIGNSGDGAIKITLLTTDVYSQNYTYGNKYSNLPTPTRDGYTFGGWYTGENGTGTKIDENTLMSNTSDHTLYAKWTANTYTITYNANGGSGTMDSMAIKYNDSVSIKANTFTRNGYTFAGWTTNSNGIDDSYGWTGWSGTWKYIDGQYGITGGKLNLYARWTANTYYLDLNGYLDGTSSGGISDYGTADVYINGSLVCNDCTDYYTEHPYGTTYSITDIKATGGHAYRGVHSGSLSGTITGTTSVYLSFDTTDTTKPTCSLSLSGSNISASYNDNVGVAYYGWSSSYSGSNSASKSISSGTHTFYVKDTSGNTNTCSITVASTSTSKSCNAEAIKSAKFGSAHGCNVYNGTPSCTYVSGNTCSCVYTPYYSGSNYYYYCCPGGVSADWNNKLPSGLPSCTQSFSSDSYITTTYSCSSGYTKFNNSWCYK